MNTATFIQRTWAPGWANPRKILGSPKLGQADKIIPVGVGLAAMAVGGGLFGLGSYYSFKAIGRSRSGWESLGLGVAGVVTGLMALQAVFGGGYFVYEALV